MTSKNRRKNNIFLAFATLALAACSGGSGGDNGNNNGNQNPPPAAFNAVFSEIQSNVFTPTCAVSGCHTGAGAPQGLRLDEANSYGLLVDQPSSQVPATLRVAPGDPDNSYLIQKLEGTASVGAQMPLNGTPLEQSTIDIIRQWITDGALDDRAPSPDPIRVTSLSPVPGSDLDTAPTEIVAMFDRELDVSTVNASTFILEASGGDGTFGDGNESTITAAAITTSPASAPMTATFDLAAVALDDDTYRVRLLGDGASMILDIDANALDGEFSGAFPSGDGTQGGDFEATFTLTTAVAGPTLDELQAAIFGPRCAGCHSGPTSGDLPSGMDMSSADATFNNLVGVASIQEPALSRVSAGDPGNSYLVQKLEGTAATGQRMPAGGPFLDQAEIDDVRLWIANGANR
jgi:mono/diheme cytochrome c family protein